MRVGFLTNHCERVDGCLNSSRWLKVVTFCSAYETVDSFVVALDRKQNIETRVKQLKERYRIDLIFSSGEGVCTKPMLTKEGIIHVPSLENEPIRMLIVRLMGRLSSLPEHHPQRRYFEKTVEARKQRCHLPFSTQAKMTLNQLTGDVS